MIRSELRTWVEINKNAAKANKTFRRLILPQDIYVGRSKSQRLWPRFIYVPFIGNE